MRLKDVRGKQINRTKNDKATMKPLDHKEATLSNKSSSKNIATKLDVSHDFEIKIAEKELLPSKVTEEEKHLEDDTTILSKNVNEKTDQNLAVKNKKYSPKDKRAFFANNRKQSAANQLKSFNNIFNSFVGEEIRRPRMKARNSSTILMNKTESSKHLDPNDPSANYRRPSRRKTFNSLNARMKVVKHR
jgi:hypothetical protein